MYNTATTTYRDQDAAPSLRAHPLHAPDGYYGGADETTHLKDNLQARQRVFPLCFMAFLLLLPIALFEATFCVMCYTVTMALVWRVLIVIVLAIPVCVVGYLFYLSRRAVALDEFEKKAQFKRTSWYKFLFFSCVFAWVLALVAGDANYTSNTAWAFAYESRNVYSDVDAGFTTTTMVGDAGAIYFTDSSYINSTLGMVYHTSHGYCVAPIVTENTTTNFAFWAVGTDCCSGNRYNFHCADNVTGAYDDSEVVGGLRVLEEDGVYEYFLAAAEMASGAYGIRLENPMFMALMDSPEDTVQHAASAGITFGVVISIVVVVMQCFFTTSITYVLTRTKL